MRKFMGYHASQLRLIVSRFDSAPKHKHVAPRQRERVHGFVIHTMKLPGILHAPRGQLGRQLEPQLRQISVHTVILAERQLALSILGRLLAQVDILLRRKHVPAGFELCPLRSYARRPKAAQCRQDCHPRKASPIGGAPEATSLSGFTATSIPKDSHAGPYWEALRGRLGARHLSP